MEFPRFKDFCMIYELPEKLTNGFCFGGGNDINFKNVDWFNFWDEGDSFEDAINQAIANAKSKNYYKNDKRYLLLTREFKSTVF